MRATFEPSRASRGRTSRFLAVSSIESALALGFAALASGCFSPVQDDAIEAIGPEPRGLEEGPLHYPGEACLACHGGYGKEAEPTFDVGGTVYATPDSDVAVEGARVTITDAVGVRVELETNCAGNFYLTRSSSPLVFPLRAEVECTLPDGTSRRSVMGTRIQREGSCASCHERGPAKPTGPAQVYCAETMPTPAFTQRADCFRGEGEDD
jgi:hypothetical protein